MIKVLEYIIFQVVNSAESKIEAWEVFWIPWRRLKTVKQTISVIIWYYSGSLRTLYCSEYDWPKTVNPVPNNQSLRRRFHIWDRSNNVWQTNYVEYSLFINKPCKLCMPLAKLPHNSPIEDHVIHNIST